MSFKNLKIGISGVRGIVGDTLTPELITNLVQSFSTLIRRGSVAVAADSRISRDFIKQAVFSGLIYSGIQPIDTGILPTPSLQNYVKERNLAGGIIITASHNPKEWNGLKFVGGTGLFLLPFRAQHLINIYHQHSYIVPPRNEFPDVITANNPFEVHQEKILRIVDLDRIRSKQFKVMIDPGGGAGTPYVVPFLEQLGCKVTLINDDMENNFPRPPEPLPENLQAASSAMKSGDFDIGFAQDADADRLALLTEDGRCLDGEYTLALALDGYLHDRSEKVITLNLSTSRMSEYIAKKHKGSVQWTAVGEINVVEKMLEIGSIAGGEGNGGVIIPEVHPCRDSFTGMALVLEKMARDESTVTQMIAELPKYKTIRTKIPFSTSGAHKIIAALRSDFTDADLTDGIKQSTGEYWFHIRPSNTEPILRIIAEGDPDSIDSIVKDLKARVKEIQKNGN